MTATNKLGLELLQNAAANQTLANTTFALLNQLVQAGVVDKDLAAPPSSPSDESLYIVGASATGAWAGRNGQLAYWLVTAGAWQFVTPKEGFFLHVNDEDVFYKFTGTAWEVFSGGGGGGGMTNPMTSIRDLIVGGTGGAPTRLPGPASEGMVLTRIGNALGWAPGGGDFKKDGSTQMTGPFNQAPVVEYPQTDSVLDWSQVNSDTASSPPSVTGISAMAGAPAGARRLVKFGEGHKLYHIEGTLELPGKADISTRSGDSAEFLYRGNNRWQCVWYTRADGTALVASAGFTEAQVRATPLTGLPATSGDVTETDSVLSGIGKLQASKVAKESGKGLSANDYTTTEKNKLTGIAEGAQVNSVTSVASRTGAVTLAKGDVGLANVDNTADSAKPVSTAQQTALNAKANRTNPAFDGATTTFATEVVRHDPSAGINAGYEIGSTAGQATTPYMDFHCGATPTDYDVRFLFSGGNGSSGNGGMTFMGATLTLGGRVICNLPLRPAQYTLSTLPSAAAYDGYEIDVTNATVSPAGPKRCRSNGTNWLILNTNTPVS